MWAAHSWTVEPIYKHLYSLRHLIHSPDDDEKLHFEDLISFFCSLACLLLSDVDLSLMNWTSEYVLACSRFNYPCCWGFLTVLITLALSGSSWLFANDSFSSRFLFFFFFFFSCFTCQKKIETCLCASSLRPPVIIIQVDCWLTTNWMRNERRRERESENKAFVYHEQKTYSRFDYSIFIYRRLNQHRLTAHSHSIYCC